MNAIITITPDATQSLLAPLKARNPERARRDSLPGPPAPGPPKVPPPQFENSNSSRTSFWGLRGVLCLDSRGSRGWRPQETPSKLFSDSF